MTVGTASSISPIVTGVASVFSITPELPLGLTVDPVTGTIMGTPSVESPITTYTLATTDPSNQKVNLSFQLTVYLAPTISVVGSPFTFIQGTPISAINPIVSASVFNVTISPALPTGLTLVPSSGVIQGNPRIASALTTYTLTAANPAGATAATTVNIQVTAASVAISYAGSPYLFTTGDSVSITPTLSIGTVTISPALANGLSMDASGTIFGTASGTLAPTIYTLTATNGVTATTTISIQIVAPPVILYTGSPFTLTKGTVASITPTTLTSVVATSISPSLPATLAISATNGNVTGTPNATAANATYTVTATNLAGRTTTTTFDLKINDVAPAITYAGSPFIYTTGDVVSLTPATLSGTLTISPALSNGLSMNSTTGVISGTTTTTLATTAYTVTATNSTGQTTTASISIQIVAAPAITYAGSPYVVNTGDVVSISPATSVGLITISPALGNSLSISGTGTISGTASGVMVATTYTVTATNAAGATASTTILIGPNNPIHMVQTITQAYDTSSITLPGPSTAGNLMVLTIALEDDVANYAGGVSATDNYGNNYVLAAGINSDYVYTGILYAKNITVGSSTPITITLSVPSAPMGDDSDAELTATEFSGIDPVSPIDQVATQTFPGATFPTTINTGTLAATTHAYDLLISTFSSDGNISGANFTQTTSPVKTVLASKITDNNGVSAGETDYAIVASTGTYSTNWNVTAYPGVKSNASSAAIVAFKGAQSTSHLAPATQIVLTSATQTLITHQCSTALSAVSEDAGNNPAAVTADQSVTLSGNGLLFYSDSNCTLPISSLLFTPSNSTTQNFYFAATTPGTITLAATPGTFAVVTQLETITLAPKTWLGGGGNANWSNAANWSGGSVPNSYDTAIFDSNCTSCNATADTVNTSVALTTYSSYTGTITNAATTPTFLTMALGGGTFNAGAGTLIIEGDFTYSPTATFNAQTGTVQFGDAGSNGIYITSYGGTPTFNNLHMQDPGTAAYALIRIIGKIYVAGDLTLDNAITTSSNTFAILNSYYGSGVDKIYVAGNLIANTNGGGGGGNSSAILVMNGNNNTQTVTGAADGILPSLEIAHTGTGGVNFVGTIVIDGNLTQTSGTVNPGISTVQIGRGDSNWDADSSLSGGTINFYNLSFNKQVISTSFVDIFSGTYTIANNFIVNNVAGANAIVSCGGSSPPVFNLNGNLTLGTQGLTSYCAGQFNFVGTSTQTVTSTGGILSWNDIEVNKTGGSLSLASNINIPAANFTIQQGTLNLAGYIFSVAYTLKLEAAAILNCNGGCGGTVGLPSPPAMLPNVCGLGTGDLVCGTLENFHGGVINP